jgi:glycosyltransferase involved in cell wall biosynthesis
MQSSLNIVHFDYDHPENPWVGGGGSLRAVVVNTYLARWGHRVAMVCGNSPGRTQHETQDGFEVYRFGSARSYHASRVTYALNARRVLRMAPCDLIVDDTSAYSFSVPYLSSRKPRVAIVHHLFGAHVFHKNPLAGLLPFVFEKLNLRAYRYFITGSHSVHQQISAAHPEAVVTHIPYGVDDTLFEAPSQDGDYLLYFGRIDIYNKGLDTLLEAFALLRKSRPSLRLVCAGGGKDEAAFRSRVASHPERSGMEVTGRVTEEMKHQLIGNSLLLCMPSRYEGWGIVALEAAACGKAVVGSDIPGLRDAVVDGATGLLVPPGNPAAFAEAALRLADDAAMRRELGRAARERARQYQWESIARRQEQFYYEVLAGYERRRANRPRTATKSQ